MLAGEEITNTAVVVTRYFGGIKLGTGGLVRAYSSTAKLALEGAGIAEVRENDILRFGIGYTYYGKLKNGEKDGIFTIEDAVFEDDVKLVLRCDPADTESVRKMLSELTGGACAGEKITVEKTLRKNKKLVLTR